MPLNLTATEKRDLTPELMDDPRLDPSLHAQALRGLARINRFSLAADAFWKPIKHFYFASGRKPLRILDIAAGGGDILTRLSLKAQNEKLPFIFEGCDVSGQAVAFARQRAEERRLNINYFILDALRETIPERFDVVMCSLFLHHLTEAELKGFLKALHQSRAKLILLCDLKRCLTGLLLAYMGTRFLSRSPVVHVDGPQSVRAAFTTQEVVRLAREVGVVEARASSVWPERYLLSWRKRL